MGLWAEIRKPAEIRQPEPRKPDFGHPRGVGRGEPEPREEAAMAGRGSGESCGPRLFRKDREAKAKRTAVPIMISCRHATTYWRRTLFGRRFLRRYVRTNDIVAG